MIRVEHLVKSCSKDGRGQDDDDQDRVGLLRTDSRSATVASVDVLSSYHET